MIPSIEGETPDMTLRFNLLASDEADIHTLLVGPGSPTLIVRAVGPERDDDPALVIKVEGGGIPHTSAQDALDGAAGLLVLALDALKAAGARRDVVGEETPDA